MAARPRRTERCKTLRLACCNADGVRGRKLELEHFLSQHGVDICPLCETFLKPDQAFRLANFVCHRTDRLTAGGGIAILVRRGIVDHSVTVPGLTHLEATAIQVTMAGRPVKILAVYLSPSHPLIGADLTACFGGGLPVLMAGDLNVKHVDWNTRMTTRRGNSYAIMPTGIPVCSLGRTPQPPTHKPIRYSRCLGHRINPESLIPSVSDFVLFTKLGTPPGTHRHCVSLFLSSPTGSL
jgi:hypothetical protein